MLRIAALIATASAASVKIDAPRVHPDRQAEVPWPPPLPSPTQADHPHAEAAHASACMRARKNACTVELPCTAHAHLSTPPRSPHACVPWKCLLINHRVFLISLSRNNTTVRTEGLMARGGPLLSSASTNGNRISTLPPCMHHTVSRSKLSHLTGSPTRSPAQPYTD
jgi:hypothetical protein